jgi:hypothetical protein
MKEASSDASSEALKELSRLSRDGCRLTNQLYEKLSIERGCEVSIGITLDKIFRKREQTRLLEILRGREVPKVY